MTKEEKLCNFMEPKPKRIPRRYAGGSKRWWLFSWCKTHKWEPVPLTLDRLRLIEERLTEEQWCAYLAFLASSDDLFCIGTIKPLVHASARQKIDALASVLDTEGRGSTQPNQNSGDN